MGKGMGKGAEGTDDVPPVARVPTKAKAGPNQGPFPALKEAREGLQVKWYRCPMPKGKLSELMTRSDAKGLRQGGGHLALWCCTASLVHTCWARGMWPACVAAMWLHGVVGSSMVSLLFLV